jgi:hypothetical protein
MTASGAHRQLDVRGKHPDEATQNTHYTHNAVGRESAGFASAGTQGAKAGR